MTGPDLLSAIGGGSDPALAGPDIADEAGNAGLALEDAAGAVGESIKAGDNVALAQALGDFIDIYQG